MDVNKLIGSFLGGQAASGSQASQSAGLPSGMSGALGGAAAGGLMALLLGNKKSRKMVQSAATYGGMAVLGGLAYRAYQNWQQNQNVQTAPTAGPSDMQQPAAQFLPDHGGAAAAKALQLSLIRTMIAAAKADGHIDGEEMKRIFNQTDSFNLSGEEKEFVFTALREEIAPETLAEGVVSMEHKSELYVAACLACEPDNQAERAFLDSFAKALQLPAELQKHLEHQAVHALG